ncbi:DUF2489 domain-containing protein [Alkalimonas sp. MEB108]|uniref:DUF2489 domain-containing protein n=1 Tax=Alkalimonas cellulosilytica TaxID=3058395 RepID=A0ABU7J671_9GAMM|nr:DUF2489 domain-containing protein [Alkalimonas sp. MEB108]MEE2002011.1 DUF2489 domain-containing protein [Alkalimonas sp. MEB108]
MSGLWWMLLLAGAAIIAGLAFYAGRLLLLVRVQQQQQELARQKKNQYLIDSIVLISRAMQSEQCELSEGALRVWVLLDHLELANKADPVTEYPGICQMYEVVKDMPTHKARKQHDKAHIRQLDKIREKAEVDLKDFILADVEKLLSQYRELVSS